MGIYILFYFMNTQYPKNAKNNYHIYFSFFSIVKNYFVSNILLIQLFNLMHIPKLYFTI